MVGSMVADGSRFISSHLVDVTVLLSPEQVGKIPGNDSESLRTGRVENQVAWVWTPKHSTTY